MTRRFENCQDAVGNPIDKADGIDSSDFFNQIFTAQFGIWMSFTGTNYDSTLKNMEVYFEHISISHLIKTWSFFDFSMVYPFGIFGGEVMSISPRRKFESIDGQRAQTINKRRYGFWNSSSNASSGSLGHSISTAQKIW